MSVLINSMGIPKSCSDCPLNYDEMSCAVTGTRWWSDTMVLLDFDYTKERLHDCPLSEVPSAQPEKTQLSRESTTKDSTFDCISRQAAIDALGKIFPADPMRNDYTQGITCGAALATEYIKQLPSVQPERTCVNCGRTANNGGWYADGRTRCPIEEHYALPKDGFCHLWEKRNVTDDDYPERMEE